MIRDTLLLLRLLIRGGLLTVGLLWLVHVNQTETPTDKPKVDTLSQRLTRCCGLGQRHIEALVRELGPAVVEELKQGRAVQLPGLGTLRLVDGPEPMFIMSPGGLSQTAPRKGLEFVPTSALLQALHPPERNESGRTFAVRPGQQ